MKVIAKEVPKSTPYLTAEKVYEATPVAGNPHLAFIENDEGRTSTLCLYSCAHLEGAPWTIVEE